MKKICLIVSTTLAILVTCCNCLAQNDRRGTEIFTAAVEKIKTAKSGDDLNEAFRKFQQAYSLFDKAGDAQGKAYCLLFFGKINLSQADYPKAIDHANKSLDLMKKIGDRNGQAINLDNLGSSYYYTSNYTKSLEYFNQSLKIHRSMNNSEGEALTLNNIGNVYVALTDYDKARTAFSDSLIKGRKAKNRQVEAATLDTLGYIHGRLGAYQEALENHKKALELQRLSGNVAGEGICLNNIGQIHQESGQYPESIEYFEKALILLERIGDIFASSKCTNNIGVSLASMGEYSKALEYYADALKSQQKSGDLLGAAGASHNIGSVYMKLGQYSKALEYYNEALSITRKTGNKADCSVMLINVANALNRLGKDSEAEKAYLEAIKIRQDTGLPTISATDEFANFLLDNGKLSKVETFSKNGLNQWTLGRIALLRNDCPVARNHFEETVRVGERNRNADFIFVGHTGMGRSFECLGKYDQARAHYEKATKITEDMRSGLLPAERASFLDVRLAGFARSDAAKGLARVLMKLKKPEEAIAPIELTKARAFADHLYRTNATGASQVPIQLLQEEQALVSSVAVLKKAISKTDPKTQAERYENLSNDLKLKSSRLEKLIDTLRSKHPAYAAAKYPKAMVLSESTIHPLEYVIVFDVSSDGVTALLTHEKKILRSSWVDWKEAELSEAVQRFRKPLETLKFIDFEHDLGRTIYARLLKEVLTGVPKGSPIVIVPDGPLAILPFEALVTGGEVKWEKGKSGFHHPDGLVFLNDDHPVTYYQSLTAMTLGRNLAGSTPRGRGIAVIADPIFEITDKRAQITSGARIATRDGDKSIELMRAMEDFSQGKFRLTRLEGTSVLAQSLEKIYGKDCLVLEGMKAGKNDFMSKVASNMNRFGSVVFATHGAMSSQIPGLMEPFLALTMVPPGTDGFLKMSDILSMKMNVEIVALTACQTGLGKDVSGEGVMSMGRAFQYAGARSVLMTLWEVEEASATKLTEAFFKHRKDGKSKLEALHAAREEIRKAGYRHPYFWSAFILVGDAN